MNYENILKEIYEEIQPYLAQGHLPDYIPALKNVKADDFAMSLITLDGEEHHIGCHDKKFSIQSISKLFSFTIALDKYKKKLYKRVGHESSGNPFINAGAIVTTDSLVSIYKEKTFETILEFKAILNNAQS